MPLAARLALGRADFIDGAYIAVILLFLFLGGYWLSSYCAISGLNPLFGFGFLLVSATLISIDRLTVDIALAALCIGFARHARLGSSTAAYAVLMAAPLVRETGLLLAAGYVAHLFFKKQARTAVLFATSVIPAAIWYLFVMSKTDPGGDGGVFSLIPFQGLVMRLLTPTHYDLPAMINAIVTVLDYLALGGVALAVVLAMRMAAPRFTGPIEMAVYPRALLTIFLVYAEPWRDPFGYARALSPLLLFTAASGITRGEWIGVLPGLLVSLRVIAQLEPQGDRNRATRVLALLTQPPLFSRPRSSSSSLQAAARRRVRPIVWQSAHIAYEGQPAPSG